MASKTPLSKARMNVLNKENMMKPGKAETKEAKKSTTAVSRANLQA